MLSPDQLKSDSACHMLNSTYQRRHSFVMIITVYIVKLFSPF